MPNINDNTIIQFNLKWFLGIVFSLLTAFIGFYFTIQKPNNDSVKGHMDQLMLKEREYQNVKFEKLDEMNGKIDDLQLKVDALNRRNDDLNELRGRNDTGASLGN